jgi:hypothetical protein
MRIAIDDVPASVVRDALEDILTGTATTSERDHGVAQRVQGPRPDAGSLGRSDERLVVAGTRVVFRLAAARRIGHDEAVRRGRAARVELEPFACPRLKQLP